MQGQIGQMGSMSGYNQLGPQGPQTGQAPQGAYMQVGEISLSQPLTAFLLSQFGGGHAPDWNLTTKQMMWHDPFSDNQMTNSYSQMIGKVYKSFSHD